MLPDVSRTANKFYSVDLAVEIDERRVAISLEELPSSAPIYDIEFRLFNHFIQ